MGRARRIAAVVAATAACGVLSGCTVGLEDLPAPAGTDGATYHVTAVFDDVQNLALGAEVKLGGVVVGEVTSISTKDYHAYVGLDLEKRYALGRDVALQIRFTTPLGEDFVSVRSAGHPAQRGRLSGGATVPVSSTSDAPNIEDTFSAVSLLLNGGGLSKLQVIARELDLAFHGRTGDARTALVNLDRVIASLDAHKGDIDATLTGLQQMAVALDRGTSTINQALDLFPSVLDTLAAQTAKVRDLLVRVGRLGTTVRGLLDRGQAAMLRDLDNLRPTLQSLQARQQQLIPTFTSLIALGNALRRAAPGDYVNISATIEFLLQAPPARPPAHGTAHPETDSITRLYTGGLPGGADS